MRHGGHADKGAHFNHVWQNLVGGAAEFFYAIDDEHVGADAADLCAHAVQHPTELLQVGFAGCIVDGGSAFGHCGSHHDVGRTSNGGLIEQHIGSLQCWCFQVEETIFRVIGELYTEFFKTDDVRIQPPPSDLITAGFWDECFSIAGEERACDHNRSPEPATFGAEGLGVQVLHIDIICLEDAGAAVFAVEFNTHIAQQFNQEVDVKDVRNIPDLYRPGRQ